MEACSSSFYIKLLKEAETLCVPTSREWAGAKVEETHWSTPYKIKLRLSPVLKLSTSKINLSTIPNRTADHHFAQQFCPESSWSLIAIFLWVFIFKLAVSSLFIEPQLTSIYIHCMLRYNFWLSCGTCCICINFCPALTNERLHISCHDQAQVAILCLQVILHQDHKNQDSQNYVLGTLLESYLWQM